MDTVVFELLLKNLKNRYLETLNHFSSPPTHQNFCMLLGSPSPTYVLVLVVGMRPFLVLLTRLHYVKSIILEYISPKPVALGSQVRM